VKIVSSVDGILPDKSWEQNECRAVAKLPRRDARRSEASPAARIVSPSRLAFIMDSSAEGLFPRGVVGRRGDF